MINIPMTEIIVIIIAVIILPCNGVNAVILSTASTITSLQARDIKKPKAATSAVMMDFLNSALNFLTDFFTVFAFCFLFFNLFFILQPPV